jgi:hypothetical protein
VKINFQKQFGGLKMLLYLCTPLPKQGNGKVKKSSLEIKSKMRG